MKISIGKLTTTLSLFFTPKSCALTQSCLLDQEGITTTSAESQTVDLIAASSLAHPMCNEENLNTVVNAWNLMDQYQQYPIGNRGLAAFFSTELKDHINTFRAEVINEASIEELYNNLNQVFVNLELSTEYFELKNQKYLRAALASLLSCLTYYTHSQNRFDEEYKALVKAAESFALWGTGGCENISSLMFLLLASSNLRPLREIFLQSSTHLSAHCLILIGGPEDVNKDNFYDSDGFVIDYWSGCMGIAKELFKPDGSLYSFRQRAVTQAYYLSNEIAPLPKFIFPRIVDLDEVRTFVDVFYQEFCLIIKQKEQEGKKEASNPKTFFLIEKYTKRAKEVNFHDKYSCYCIEQDEYDRARDANVNQYV